MGSNDGSRQHKICTWEGFSPLVSSSLLTHIPEENRGWKCSQGFCVGLTINSKEHWLPTQMTALTGSGNSSRKQIFPLGMRGCLQCWRTQQIHTCLKEPAALQHSLHTPNLGSTPCAKQGEQRLSRELESKQSPKIHNFPQHINSYSHISLTVPVCNKRQDFHPYKICN